MLLLHRMLPKSLRQLFVNTSGNVVIIFAFALLPMLLAMGAAIDYGHGNAVRVRIQAALDATGLMLAQSIGTMPVDDLLDQADDFFAVNFIAEKGVAISPLDVEVVGETIMLSASAVIDTSLMALGGINKMYVGATTEVVRSEDSYEVVLVLDNTGSMAGSKIRALQDASELLINNLFGETENHPLLEMGVVPFSHAVNVGTDNRDAAWMDTQARNPLHRENFDDEFVDQKLTRFALFDRFRNDSWGGCVEARAYPLDVSDVDATGTNPKSLFVPYFAPDEPGDDYSSRRGSHISGYSNSYLDDLVEKSDRRASETKRQEYTLKYTDRVKVEGNGSDHGPNYGCTAKPILPLTNKKTQVKDAIDGMQANGYTNITEGLMWGMRVISPGPPFTEGKAYGTDDHHKIIVLLTDGENRYPSTSTINKSEYGPYGFMASGRLVNSNRSSMIEAKMNDRTEEACGVVKDKDILLFTITFQVSDSNTAKLMRNCATEPSMYYDSPNTGTLKTVFKSIATRISELRISK